MEFNQHQILLMGLNWNFQWLEDPIIQKIIKILDPYDWRLVGGCVRDNLINHFTYDIDINTPLEPTFVENLFQDFTINTIGRDHGTVMVFAHPYKIEITTLRKDVITDGRHAQVAFTNSWEEDSNRRDFTINGLMMDYKQQKIYDYHGGIFDLISKQVKFIGNFQERIQEDYLRILRFIRFSVRFGHHNDFFTVLETIKPLVPGLKKVSQERIINEISIAMGYESWMTAIKAIKILGIDHIIASDFNDDFSNFQGDTYEEKWASVLLIKPNNFSRWSLDSCLKKTLTKSNYDYDQWGPSILFNVYTDPLFNIKVMMVKNYILYGNKVESFFINLKHFLSNETIKTQFNQEKIKIVKSYQGSEIKNKIIEYLWNLWLSKDFR